MWPGGEEHRGARAGGSEVGAPSVMGRRVSGVRSGLVLPDWESGLRRGGWVPAPRPPPPGPERFASNQADPFAPHFRVSVRDCDRGERGRMAQRPGPRPAQPPLTLWASRCARCPRPRRASRRCSESWEAPDLRRTVPVCEAELNHLQLSTHRLVLVSEAAAFVVFYLNFTVTLEYCLLYGDAGGAGDSGASSIIAKT